MKRPRDSQRSKVWTAEGKVDDKGLDFKSWPEMAGWGQTIVDSRWYTTRNPWKQFDQAVHVGYSHGCVAGANRYGIHLPRLRDRQKLRTVHSLAHLIVPGDVAWHGPEFCRTYLEMVGKYIDANVERELLDQFKDGRVKLRVITPEAKAAAEQRKLQRLQRRAETFPDELKKMLNRLRD